MLKVKYKNSRRQYYSAFRKNCSSNVATRTISEKISEVLTSTHKLSHNVNFHGYYSNIFISNFEKAFTDSVKFTGSKSKIQTTEKRVKYDQS